MSRIAIGVIVLLAVGLTVGVIGGLVLGEPWFHGGEVVACAGLLGLWALSLWKQPPSIVDIVEGDAPSSEEMPLNIPRAEAVLKSRDSGAVVGRK